jgi:hypothetical protein
MTAPAARDDAIAEMARRTVRELCGEHYVTPNLDRIKPVTDPAWRAVRQRRLEAGSAAKPAEAA